MREIGEAIVEKYKNCLMELVWDGLDLDEILAYRDLPQFDDLWIAMVRKVLGISLKNRSADVR